MNAKSSREFLNFLCTFMFLDLIYVLCVILDFFLLQTVALLSVNHYLFSFHSSRMHLDSFDEQFNRPMNYQNSVQCRKNDVILFTLVCDFLFLSRKPMKIDGGDVYDCKLLELKICDRKFETKTA